MVRHQTSDGHIFVIGFFFLMEIEKSDNQTSDKAVRAYGAF